MAQLQIQSVNDLGAVLSFFTFDETNAIRVQKYDPGYPENRVVEDFRPHQNGMVSYTKYFGAREINIEFMVLPQITPGVVRKNVIDTLRSFCNPALKTYLVDAVDGGTARRILVKPSTLSLPYEFVNRTYGQIQWRCPDGFWEGTTLNDVILGQISQAANPTGRQYPLVYTPVSGPTGRQYPTGVQPVVGNVVANSGNMEAYPIIRMYGPFTEVEVTNNTATPAKRLKFNAFAAPVAAGEWVEVDLRNKTALLNGNINTSVYDKIDWSLSEWWSMPIGTNTISFTPVGATVGATQCRVIWRDNWL